jgi:APA family basic amino acid/polyamine antiporter
MNQPSSTAPARQLGVFDAGCIVVGAIIGVGIFFTPSRIAKLAGDSTLSMTIWAVAGFIALCGALAFASLGRRYNANGAQYEILRDAYGPFTAFLFVVCNCVAVQAGATAIISLVCVNNLTAAAGTPPLEGVALKIAATLLIASLAAANIAGVRWGSGIQNLTVVAKVLVLACIVGIAVLSTRTTDEGKQIVTTALSPAKALFAGLIPAFFAYGGWQHALWITGEVKDPRRTVPRAVIGGVIVVTLVYVTANWAYLELLGVGGVSASKSLAADCAGRVLPAWSSRLAAAVVAFSAFGVLNAQLLSGPRLVYGMARDGRFFRVFGRLHRRWSTPWAAVSLLAACGILLVLAGSFDAIDQLTTGVVLIDCIFFILSAWTVLLFHYRRVQLESPFVLAATLAFCLGEACVVAGAWLDPNTRTASWIGVGFVCFAAALYVVFFRRRHAAEEVPNEGEKGTLR